MTFLSTQFTPVEEAERFRKILSQSVDGNVSYVPSEIGQFTTQVRVQIDSDSVEIGLLGGLHSELVPFAGDYVNDVTDLVAELGDSGWPKEYVRLSKCGTDQHWYVPWAEGSYLMAARTNMLEHLPSGADPQSLTYDQFLDWAIAARKANGGRPVVGLPGGPEGLLYRFIQGYLLPSFTGGQITTFRSQQAIEAWQYMRELWQNTVPTSTTYDEMQEPLASGEVSIAWDHVARLKDAPKGKPEEWTMFPSPHGPKGLGYMEVLAGLAIPKDSTNPELAREIIIALSKPDVQVSLLRANAFFPTVNATLPDDLPPAIKLLSDALNRQRTAEQAMLALPPVGLGAREAEVSKVFQDCFRLIVLDGADIRSTVDEQAQVLEDLLKETNVPCWAPDPPSGNERCSVA